MEARNLSGDRFGRLTAIEIASEDRRKWRCACTCGATIEVFSSNLLRGNTRSCGCLRREESISRFTTHGQSNKTRAYRCWAKMKTRCDNPNVPDYPRYGGRGIKVCERWQDFANFAADMGEPDPGMTLDRIDNNKGYSPENCRWLTRKEQNRNRRDNVLIATRGQTRCISAWAEISGIGAALIRYRHRAGWPAEDAIFLPPKRSG